MWNDLLPDVSFWPNMIVERRIGSGSYSTVFLLRSMITNELSVLKLIEIPRPHQVFTVDESIEKQLFLAKQEIALQSLMYGSPYVVRLIDSFVKENESKDGYKVYIRLDYSHPLKEVHKEIGIHQIIQMGIDICTALTDFEQNKILFLDIKPQNIFQSDSGIFQISDFGCAMEKKPNIILSRRGTYHYAAPEVLKAEYISELSYSVDVYALGVVLYELLNDGYLPFQNQAVSKYDRAERNKALRIRLSGAPLSAPARGNAFLSAAVMKACAFIPEQRFSSAYEFLKSLQLIKSGCKDIEQILIV